MKRLLLLALFWLAALGHAEAFSGKVIGITDGDTITVLDDQNVQHKVRLAGIDAPEKNQPYGQRSKQSLSNLIYGKGVSVETTKRDRYGRHVGTILLGDQDVNLEQIRLGFAWYYRKYGRELAAKDRRLYDAAEAEARSHRVGLWADINPTPPWDFRRPE
ncbi:MAG: thermonuclease family protein [Burkholderiales bacterium]|nr:thermonuclease family protein [Burkholderiales bacterium]